MADTLVSRFVKGTISTGLGKLSTMILSLTSTMIVTRHLPAEDFGMFVLIMVVVNFLAQVSTFGLGISLPRFVAGTKDEKQRRKLVNTALYFRLFTIMVVSLLALPLRTQIAALFGSPVLPRLAVFIPLLFFLQSSTSLSQSALQGFFLFKRIGVGDFIASSSNLLFTWVFVLLLRRGLVGLAYAKAISLSMSLAFVYYSIPIRKKIEFHPYALREMLVFGLPLQVNDILSLVFSRIDTVIIGILLGPAGVGYYEVARRIPEYIRQGYEAFRSVYFPLMSGLFMSGEKKRATQVLNNSTRLVSFGTITATLIALLFGKELFVLVFSEQYSRSVPAFILLMVSLNIGLIGYTLGISIVAVGDSDKPVIVNIVHVIASLVGNLVFIPPFGITGAALASVAGIIPTNPLDVLLLRRRDVHVRAREYLKPILIFAVHAIGVLLLRPTTFPQKILVMMSFLFVSVFLSVITAGDLNALLAGAKPTLHKAVGTLLSGSGKS
jgi:O-antigen/teichoic acid export membrane protein